MRTISRDRFPQRNMASTTSPDTSSDLPGRSRQLARASALTAIAVILAGCSGEEPSDLESPDVIWPTTNPTSQWDDSPNVEVLRDGFYESAIAWNNLDYTDKNLIELWGYSSVEDMSRVAQDLFRDYYYDFDIADGADASPYLVQSARLVTALAVVEDGRETALIDRAPSPRQLFTTTLLFQAGIE